MAILRVNEAPRRLRQLALGGALVLSALAVPLWSWLCPWLSSPEASPGAGSTLGRALPAPQMRPAAGRVQDTTAAPEALRATAAHPGAAAGPCPYQQLALSNGSAPWLACVAETRTQQSGDLRSYVLDAQGVSTWRLRVDMVAGAVHSARLSGAAGADYGCEADACQGISLGARDAHGARTLVLGNALLRRLVHGPDAEGQGLADAHDAISVSARLRVAGDQQLPDLACADATVQIVQQDGAALSFCPGSGAGVATADEGRRIVTLRSLEGENLVVGIDAAGRVDRIEFAGLSCDGDACSGATTFLPASPPDSAASEQGRRFMFSGTRLTAAPGSRRSAMLNGSATLPTM